jgi:hypothetical protein
LTISITESYGRVRVHVSGKADRARDSYASGIRIPHSSPSVKSNSRSDKQFCYRQISPDTRNKGKETQLYNTTTICLGLGDRKKHTHTTDKLFLQDQTSVGEQQHPRRRLHLRRNPTRPRTTTRSEDLRLEGTCRHHAWAIAARVSSGNLARADGSTGRFVASASYPPRTSARLMASAT